MPQMNEISMEKIDAIICDIDGTIALKGERNPFDWDRVDEDTVNEPIANLVRIIRKSGLQIVLVSGRKEQCRAKTLTWIWENDIPATELFMRKDNDNRSDVILKKELYEQVRKRFYIHFVLDDRKQVVDMWRKLGLTVLAVAEGDF